MKSAFICLVVTICCLPLYSQKVETWQFIVDSGIVAWDARDAAFTEDGGLFILGAEYLFLPPYGPGIPIEGDPILGNVLLQVNTDGTLLSKQRIPNVFMSPFRQNIPAYFFTSLSHSEIAIPHSSHVGVVSCISGLTFTNRRGLAFISIDHDSLLINNNLYNTAGLCEWPFIYGSALINNTIVVIDGKDRPEQYPVTIRWYDTTGLEVKNRLLESDNWLSIQSNVNNLIEWKNQLLIVGGDSRDAYRMSLLLLDFQGDSIDLISIRGEKLNTDRILFHDDKRGILLSGRKHTANGTYYVLVNLDESLHEVWRCELTGRGPTSAIALPDGGFVVIHDFNRVTRIDRNGRIVASRNYGTWGNDKMSKILLEQDGESFVVVGTRETNRQQSTLGDPFIRIFVLRDKIVNLDPVGTQEVPAFSSGLVVYPNPASVEAYADVPPEFGPVMHSTLSDLQGRMLRRDFLAPTDRYRFDCAGLPAGVYLLSITNCSGQRMTGKLFVSR